jgi:TRAP-type mannitol/chloroaromatic compound transport system permease small subunit
MMLDALLWVLRNIGMAFYNFGYAVTHPLDWLDWSNKEALMRFIYYGASVELLFVVLTAFLLFTAIGMWRNTLLWGAVRGLEGFTNGLGRIVAWAGLIMVLQQILIIFLQRIFRVSEISVGPFGFTFTADISWFSEELKLYNAAIVALCVGYTFVQRGHVRVDLVYSAVSFRTKRVIDMFGALFFMMPSMILVWLYAWFFMWRHLVTPKVSASDKLDLLMRKATILRWNVETIGFSPNGFNGYFLFKILIVAFTALVFLQAIAFFYRSYLEWREGPESDGKYLDVDPMDDSAETAVVHEHPSA